MHTFNGNPQLMLQLAAATRSGQIEHAERRRARRGPGWSRAALGGYWGGLGRRPERGLSSAARPA
jgi:hypothetical protein